MQKVNYRLTKNRQKEHRATREEERRQKNIDSLNEIYDNLFTTEIKERKEKERADEQKKEFYDETIRRFKYGDYSHLPIEKRKERIKYYVDGLKNKIVKQLSDLLFCIHGYHRTDPSMLNEIEAFLLESDLVDVINEDKVIIAGQHYWVNPLMLYTSEEMDLKFFSQLLILWAEYYEQEKINNPQSPIYKMSAINPLEIYSFLESLDYAKQNDELYFIKGSYSQASYLLVFVLTESINLGKEDPRYYKEISGSKKDIADHFYAYRKGAKLPDKLGDMATKNITTAYNNLDEKLKIKLIEAIKISLSK